MAAVHLQRRVGTLMAVPLQRLVGAQPSVRRSVARLRWADRLGRSPARRAGTHPSSGRYGPAYRRLGRWQRHRSDSRCQDQDHFHARDLPSWPVAGCSRSPILGDCPAAPSRRWRFGTWASLYGFLASSSGAALMQEMTFGQAVLPNRKERRRQAALTERPRRPTCPCCQPAPASDEPAAGTVGDAPPDRLN
jgi:hypothetical protein